VADFDFGRQYMECTNMGDNILLQEFAASRSEAAFAALVRQHINLVFATACRQLGNHSLAEEVSQTVFVSLARKAGSLGRHPTVAGWLHKATLLECRRVLRTELRRQHREQVAVALGTVSAAGVSVWASLVPMLDEALLQLNEKDRLAVLLRFLEEKPLCEVGQALGASEDAAQKRVARALSQMTGFFRQRGFAVPALTASAPLFAAATHAAPAALACTVVAVSLAGTTTSSTLTILTLMNMTKLKLAAVSALMVAAITVPIYQQSRLRQLAAENSQLQALPAELLASRQERDEATNRLHLMQDGIDRSRRNAAELARLRGEAARLRNAAQELASLKAASGSPTQVAARDLAAIVELLKKRFEELPEKRIPELQLLSTGDWLQQAQNADMGSDIGVRKSLSEIRKNAKNKFANLLQSALKEFADANSGQLPTDLSQVAPYFKPPVDNEALARYQLTQTGSLTDVGQNRFVKEKAPVDDYDTLFEIALNGVRVQSVTPEATSTTTDESR